MILHIIVNGLCQTIKSSTSRTRGQTDRHPESLTWLPKTPREVAVDTSLGPNHTAARRAGIPRTQIWEMAATVWANINTPNRFCGTRSGFPLRQPCYQPCTFLPALYHPTYPVLFVDILPHLVHSRSQQVYCCNSDCYITLGFVAFYCIFIALQLSPECWSQVLLFQDKL